jgi:hypothetical protein
MQASMVDMLMPTPTCFAWRRVYSKAVKDRPSWSNDIFEVGCCVFFLRAAVQPEMKKTYQVCPNLRPTWAVGRVGRERTARFVQTLRGLYEPCRALRTVCSRHYRYSITVGKYRAWRFQRLTHVILTCWLPGT